ncbi:DUF742 domain-containing protein [Streptomyces carminius]|uniref:DUF742 domain-containing protein n=1 Tax=Streptomyces carminius TaxID=2665496 RepID=A0A2M8M5S0_9ACTN|nr:DUF742 domain-containing protein [Streptomyces carminius]PJE99561.1 DUF742 domain-containing protein [Streptomyces carminius]
MTDEWGDRQVVRAYVRTGGRSSPTRELDLTTLVVAANSPVHGLQREHRRIMDLCRQGALSVAEVAAHLELPLIVVKVVVSDLMDTGHLTTPAPVVSLSDVALLRRILDGLHRHAG